MSENIEDIFCELTDHIMIQWKDLILIRKSKSEQVKMWDISWTGYEIEELFEETYNSFSDSYNFLYPSSQNWLALILYKNNVSNEEIFEAMSKASNVQKGMKNLVLLFLQKEFHNMLIKEAEVLLRIKYNSITSADRNTKHRKSNTVRQTSLSKFRSKKQNTVSRSR